MPARFSAYYGVPGLTTLAVRGTLRLFRPQTKTCQSRQSLSPIVRVVMNAIHENPNSTCYSARNMAKPVNFYCPAPGAKFVSLVGDFNHWNPTSLPMEHRLDGWWFLQVHLTHGHHRYRFLVDGKPMLDPQAMGVARNQDNEEVSLLAVS